MGAGLGEVHVAAVAVGGAELLPALTGDQLSDQPHHLQPRRLAVAGAGQHQGHQGFVDQHRVGLVDERDVRVGRHQIGNVGHQLVAQDVEPDLVDGGVRDVTPVGGPTIARSGLRGDPPDRQAQRLDQRTHPLRVAAGQVVVDGDNVHVAAGQRIARRGDGAGQRLALSGGHLHDVAGHHPQRTEQLDIERTEPGHPVGGLTGDRQELRHVGGLGEIAEFEELGRLGELRVVEALGLLVELRRRLHLGHRLRLHLVGARAQ